MQECSFTPKITREDKENSGDCLNRRTPSMFYEDMIRFEKLKHKRLEEQRYLDALQLEQSMVGRSRSSSSAHIYDRLHAEELKKSKRPTDKRLVKSATTRIKVETVVSHLYQDFFSREQKLK